MSASNLTVEGEIRYIIQWFNEWSELQREDFVPIFVDYLKRDEGYVNGLVAGLGNASCTDKPMSLFQCRVKLFREWSQKWPEATKDRLKEKLRELDAGIMDKIETELKVVENGNGHVQNGHGEEEEGLEPTVEAPEAVVPEVNQPESLVNANSRPEEAITA